MTDFSSGFAPFWHWLLGGAPRPVAPREVIVVAGGTAGVGTSLITGLLGAAAINTGRATLVIDGDPAAAPARTRQLLPHFAAHDLVLIDAGSRLATIRELCGALGDMPRHGDRVLAVTTTEPTAIAASYALIKSLLARAPRLDVQLLVNAAHVAAAAAIGEHVREGAQRFLRRPIGFAGHIPDDPALDAAYRAGAHLADTLASASAAPAVHEVLARLVRSPRTTITTPTSSAAPLPASPLLLEA
jgi:MinD-like ATPase involved in chromosome partitioning or flagellar assembly